jgi:dihydrodipicolinate reductase
MTKKIKIVIASLLATGVVISIYFAAQLTKLVESDILDISEDEEEWF